MHPALPGEILYFPAAHPEHTVPSCPVNPAGHLQSVDAALAAFETELVGHAVHVAAAVAAIACEKVPLGHDAQPPLPGCCLNFPATQLVHADPSGPENPTGHRHARIAVLPAMEMAFVGHDKHTVLDVAAMAAEKVLLGHNSHAALPICLLNVPTPHSVHDPPSFPEYPRPHLQLDKPVLAKSDTELIGHGEQNEFVLPITAEYVPCAHGEHSLASPTADLYFPAWQSVQPPPPLKVPGIHKQLLADALESKDVVLAGHTSHVAIDVAPTAVEYVPTPHGAHA